MAGHVESMGSMQKYTEHFSRKIGKEKTSRKSEIWLGRQYCNWC